MHYVTIDRNTLVEERAVGCDRKEALIESAGILREIFLTSDIVARIGGDGFGVVSIETPRENIHV